MDRCAAKNRGIVSVEFFTASAYLTIGFTATIASAANPPVALNRGWREACKVEAKIRNPDIAGLFDEAENIRLISNVGMLELSFS